MSNKKKRKYTRYTWGKLAARNTRFWILYIVLVVLLALGLKSIYDYFEVNLTEYEKNQYSYVADDMATIFTEKRFDELCVYEENYNKFADTAQNVENITTDVYIETTSDYTTYLKQLAGNAVIDYTRIASTNPSELRYLVTADGKAFAEFTLTRKLDENGEPMSYSFEALPVLGYPLNADIYDKGTISINLLNPATYDYAIPSDASIFVNGALLSDDYVVKTENLFYTEHLPEGAETYYIKHYRFTCALPNTTIEVLDAEGNELKLTDCGNDTFKYEVPFVQALSSTFAPVAENFTTYWCKYSTFNCTLNNVLSLTVKNSNAYNFINSYEKIWITKADRLEIRDLKSENFLQIWDDIVCCEVSCVYHTLTSYKENDYPLHMRLYLTLDNGAWKVYDFEMLESAVNTQAETEAQ